MKGQKEAKGLGKATGVTRGIKTTTQGFAYLDFVKSPKDAISETIAWTTRLQISLNSIIGASSECVMLSGIQDKGRSLLTFEFKEGKDAKRSHLFARSIADLIVGDKSKEMIEMDRHGIC